jgi:hypothetical protein
MTPNMTRALQDAAPYGLHRFGGAWVARGAWGQIHDHGERHHKVTITALIDRALMRLYAGGTVACLTELGEQRVAGMRKAAGQ